MRMPLHLEHRCSEFRLFCIFYLWQVWSVLPYLFFLITLVWKSIYSILEWLFQLVSWEHLLGKLFSTLLLWGSACLCHWHGFLVCSKTLSPLLYIQSMSFIGKLSPLILRDIREKWLLLPVISVVRDVIVFMLLSSFWFVKRRFYSCLFWDVVSLLVLEFSIYYPLKG